MNKEWFEQSMTDGEMNTIEVGSRKSEVGGQCFDFALDCPRNNVSHVP